MIKDQAKIGLFGASSDGGRTTQQLKRLYGLTPVVFFDNDPSKWGEFAWGIRVVRPEFKNFNELDAVLVSSVHIASILRQLKALEIDCAVYLDLDTLAQDFGMKHLETITTNIEEQFDSIPIEFQSKVSKRIGIWEDAYAQSLNPTFSECRAKVRAVTIITVDFAAQAKVMATSFLAFHPEATVMICLVADRVDNEIIGYFEDSRIELFLVSEVAIDDLNPHYGYYEYCCAIRPYVFKHCLNQYPEDYLLGLDSDLLFLGRLDSIIEALSEHPFALTPHFIDSDIGLGNDYRVSRVGIFNGGLYAMRYTAETLRFLNWHGERLKSFCWPTVSQGLFLDQKWLDYILVYFPNAGICRDYACNVAPYNLPERDITLSESSGKYLVNGDPMKFYHFTSFDFEDNSYAFPMERLMQPSDHPELFELLMAYRCYVLKNQYHKWKYKNPAHRPRELEPSVKGSIQDAYLELIEDGGIPDFVKMPDLSHLQHTHKRGVEAFKISRSTESSLINEARGPFEPICGVLMVRDFDLERIRISIDSFHEYFPDSELRLVHFEGDSSRIEEFLSGDDSISICDISKKCLDAVSSLNEGYSLEVQKRALIPVVANLFLEGDDPGNLLIFREGVVFHSEFICPLKSLAERDLVIFSEIMNGSSERECGHLKDGLMSSAVILLKKTVGNRKFCEWWFERTRELCREDLMNGIFYEKKWLDLVPVLFPNSKVWTRFESHSDSNLFFSELTSHTTVHK